MRRNLTRWELASIGCASIILANMISKMKHDAPLGSRIAEVQKAAPCSPATQAEARATSVGGS